MRKNSLLIGLTLFLAACGVDAYRKVRLELPSYSPVDLGKYREVVITNLLISKSPEGFDLDKEMGAYLKLELERKFKGKVSWQRISLENEEAFKKPDFWKTLGAGSKDVLFLTGKAQLTQETRKAILGKPAKRPFEEELASQRNIEERRIFTLESSLYMIKSETGEVLLSKDFKESKTYTNLQQRADFAFYELVQRVKAKLFRPILSEERIQDRYLLVK